jgi:polysaccharide export outer membrane protein
MNLVHVFARLSLAVLGGCAVQPGVPQRVDAGQFDVVKIDDHVVDTLQARRPTPFHSHFANSPPGEPTIAAGDTVSVTLWEAASGGLLGDAGVTTAPGSTALSGSHLPDQKVDSDGAISIPYGGRVTAAGQTSAELQHRIEQRFDGGALALQALVVVHPGSANSVTVIGEAVSGARVPLAPGGDRLLQVIAAAGGAQIPVDETLVRLSRGGMTAAVPLAELVADPAEDIYAQPGDVVTLVRQPSTFSVFGATGRNAAITFARDRLSLSEALAQAGGLLDDRADPRAVFLFRYEPDTLVAALGLPPAAATVDGMSPVAYRLDLADADSYLLARRFPVRDGDVIFAADAATRPLYRFVSALSQVSGPVISGFLACHYGKC